MVKINKVYKDLIDKLENAIRAGVSIEALNPIRSVMNELKILGQRPELDSSVDSFMDITTNMAKNESIKDTLLDLANYAIMTVMWLNKRETGNDSV